MNNILILVMACTAGMVLGVIFFGGLWWTVQKGVASAYPALFFLFSAVLRMAIVVLGFYFVSGGELYRLLVCVGGFFIARIVIAFFMRDRIDKIDDQEESSHAP
jgi:F1F0 ATPase subunit 2